MTRTVRVGTRGSSLALRQTESVLGRLRRISPRTEFEIVCITTQGDRSRSTSIGLDFTDAIDRAVEEGRVDLAVHSMKDLPVASDRPVRLVAFPPRADPRDCLVLRRARGLEELPTGARLGSSSPRRRAQLHRSRPDVEVVEIRGNVDSRLARVASSELDGVVLAVAGLQRLGRADEITEILDRRRFVPAPGQGALVLAARSRDRALSRLASGIDHPPTRAAVLCERAFVAAVSGDCNTPLGVSALTCGHRLTVTADLLSPDGRRSIRAKRRGWVDRAEALGRALAGEVLRAGGASLWGRRPDR